MGEGRNCLRGSMGNVLNKRQKTEVLELEKSQGFGLCIICRSVMNSQTLLNILRNCCWVKVGS